MSTSTSAKRRARRQVATPQAVTPAGPQCEVCHIPGDKKTLKNPCGEKEPYWLCVNIAECDLRVREARRKALREDDARQPETTAPQAEPEPEAAAAEETAEVSQ